MKISISELKDIIQEEIDSLIGDANESNLEEGLEQVTPENLEILFNAVKKMTTEPAFLTTLATSGMAVAIDQIKDSIMQRTPTGKTEPSDTTGTKPMIGSDS